MGMLFRYHRPNLTEYLIEVAIQEEAEKQITKLKEEIKQAAVDVAKPVKKKFVEQPVTVPA